MIESLRVYFFAFEYEIRCSYRAVYGKVEPCRVPNWQNIDDRCRVPLIKSISVNLLIKAIMSYNKSYNNIHPEPTVSCTYKGKDTGKGKGNDSCKGKGKGKGAIRKIGTKIADATECAMDCVLNILVTFAVVIAS